jgi:hypothetical protein
VGSFTTLTGLVELNQATNNDWDDAGDVAVTFASPTGVWNEANFEARLQYDLTGTSAANVITTGGLNDTINGGAGADTMTGGGGNDTINVGAADDNVQDTVVFRATTDGSDTVNNFDNTGTGAQVDQVRLGGALNTLLDDITNNDDIQFFSGNGVNGGNVAVNLNTGYEALFLAGTNSEGVAGGSLSNAGTVAGEFNAEFGITASSGESTLLVVNSTDTHGAAIWLYTENGTTGEIQSNELALLAIVNGNADITTGQFDFIL